MSGVAWGWNERELMEIANKAIFYNRPDLQFKFDASAPPLMPSAQGIEARRAETVKHGSAGTAKARPEGMRHE